MNFDRAAWAAEKGNFEGVSRRGELVTQLDEAGIRPGSTRAQVRQLLGEPDGTGPDGDSYFLGRSQYGIDYESLHIAYSPQGIVTSLRTSRT